MSLSLENITEVFRTKEHNRDTDTDIDIHIYICIYMGFLGGSDGKASARTAGGPGLIPRSGRSPGEENGNPLQYSCLEKSHKQRNLAGYSPWGRKESDMTERLTLL